MSKVFQLTLICIVLFIFIPLFLVPTSAVNRFIILNLFWIYFVANYVLHKVCGIGSERWDAYPTRFVITSFVKNNKYLFVVLFVNFLVHIYPMVSRTILLRYDESTHVQSGLGLFTRTASMFEGVSGVDFVDFTRGFYVAVLLAIVIFRNKIRGLIRLLSRLYDQYLAVKLGVLFVVLLVSYGYFFFVKNLAFKIGLLAYPPMAKLLYLFSFTVFDVNEIAPRLVQLILGSTGAVYLYRAILLYYDKSTALLGAIVFVFNPLVAYYFNYAELGLGTVTFIIIVSFYYVRFLRSGHDNDLLLAYFLIGVGYLYKRPVFLLLAVVTIHLLIVHRRYVARNYGKILKLIWFSLWPILPFSVIAKNYTAPLSMDLSALFDSRVLIYIQELHTQISAVMVIVLAVATILIAIKDRNHLVGFLVLTFLAFNALVILKAVGHYNRFSILLYPMISVFIPIFIYRVIGRWRLALHAVTVCIAIYLFAISTFWKLPEIQPQLVLYEYFNKEHFPTDQAVRWIKEEHAEGRVLNLEVSGTVFYRDKWKIEKDKIVEFRIRDFNDYGRDEVKELIEDKGISCIMTSNGRDPHNGENIDRDVFDSTKEFSYENGNTVTVYFKSTATTTR